MPGLASRQHRPRQGYLFGLSRWRFAAMVTGVTGRSVLPPDQYVASLARKRMAATAFFRDDQGRVLLVNPVYKEMWDLPGGAVEAEESPHAACRREVAEELGLDRPPGRVLVVDWVPSRPERPEGLIVVYDGGVLSEAEVKEIVLADGELAGFAFVPGDEVAGLVTPLLARRVASCLDALEAGAVGALENGGPAA
jgi:8-oxo-dGTP diphosphatase